jgi:iron complex outermembrane recepter protein
LTKSKTSSLFQITARFIGSLLVLVGFLLFAPAINAQYDYNFQIVDAESHQNLDSVYLHINRLERKYQSNKFGHITIHGQVVPGDTITILRANYMTRIMAIPNSGDIFIKLQREPVDLSDIEIVAYTQESELFISPQSVAVLGAGDFNRNNASSVQAGLNTLPGVQMESRGDGGSKRLSIRGSLMRSPFGVRNVKVYWNEFPLTGADGSTPMELIDPEELGRVEVLKGPQGSIYGEGHGGAVLFNSKLAPYGTLGASFNTQVGSYGMQKQTFEFASSSKKTAVLLNYFRFRNDGFRQQESVRKDQLNLTTRFRAASNREVKLFLMYYDGAWGLPGELDSLGAANTPRMAHPYAVANDLRVERKWLRLGLSNKIDFTDEFQNYTAVFYTNTSKINPYGASPFFNGFKDEGATGVGVRSIFKYEIGDESLKLNMQLGGEFQRDLNALAEFEIEDGLRGNQLLYDETTSQYYNLFLKAALNVNDRLVIDASAGIIATNYNRVDLFEDDSLDFSFKTGFKPQLLPRLSTLYKLSDQYAIYTVISRGIATPTLWEIQASPNLTPESSTHYEIGLRSSLLRKALLFELNGYSTTITSAITEQPDSLGFSQYQNSGTLDLRGIEMSLKYNYQSEKQKYITAIYSAFSLGFQRYEYRNFTHNNQDYSGNELPGVPALNYNVVVDIEIRKNTRFNFSYKYFDPIPVNNANTVYAEAYTLLDLRLSHHLSIKKFYGVEIYFGAENLTDQRYNSFHRLNATNNRYFNPAPGRTFYGGLKISFSKPFSGRVN